MWLQGDAFVTWILKQRSPHWNHRCPGTCSQLLALRPATLSPGSASASASPEPSSLSDCYDLALPTTGTERVEKMGVRNWICRLAQASPRPRGDVYWWSEDMDTLDFLFRVESILEFHSQPPHRQTGFVSNATLFIVRDKQNGNDPMSQ